VGDWIQTFSGRAVWPLDPRPEEIVIEDIAHALSMQCRFTGHVRRFYSVAQHSVHVSSTCDPSDALAGLLHDASEAYLVDLARPIKRSAGLHGYRLAEQRLQRVIYQRFGLPVVEPASVELADKIMLGIEARDLMGPLLPGWEKWTDQLPADLRIDRCWTPDEAEELFLARFAELGGRA
jgi:hypothetical protein